MSAGYFNAVRMTLVAGRAFDAVETTPVAIGNETMARRYWPGASPLGARLRSG